MNKAESPRAITALLIAASITGDQHIEPVRRWTAQPSYPGAVLRTQWLENTKGVSSGRRENRDVVG